MKVTIKRDKCQGHGLCVIASPDDFVLNDEGYNDMEPFEVSDPQQQKTVMQAAQSCPEYAIQIESTETE